MHRQVKARWDNGVREEKPENTPERQEAGPLAPGLCWHEGETQRPPAAGVETWHSSQRADGFQFPRREGMQPRNLLLSCPHTWVHTGRPCAYCCPTASRSWRQGLRTVHWTTWGDVLSSSVGPLSTRLQSVCPAVLVTITCVRRAVSPPARQACSVQSRWVSVWPVGVSVNRHQLCVNVAWDPNSPVSLPFVLHGNVSK